MSRHLVLVRPGWTPPPPPPARYAPWAETVCVCGGFLGYIRGTWTHVPVCAECHDRPGVLCADTHLHCDDPEPVTCTHEADWSCAQPVSVGDECAHMRAARTCCGCCWLTAAD